MIQEPLERIEEPVFSERDVPLTREERETRNGHTSAAIFLTGRPRVVHDLERLLFHDGALVTSSRSLPGLHEQPPATAKILLSLGFIVIYDSAEIGQDARNSIALVDPGRTLDLDGENLPPGNAAAARYAFHTIKKWLATFRKAGGA
jgi:hypothetical protein